MFDILAERIGAPNSDIIAMFSAPNGFALNNLLREFFAGLLFCSCLRWMRLEDAKFKSRVFTKALR